MTKTIIQVNETKTPKGIKIKAHRADKKQIDIVAFFKPYYKKGLTIKKFFYVVKTGFLTATLVAKN